MNEQPYSYVVIRYVADRGAGECLNIGVVVYSEAHRFLGQKVDPHYERLSRAFARFDGQAYRRSMANLLTALRHAERAITDAPLLASERSFTEWLRSLMPDVGGSVSFTPPRHGVADDLREEVALLFDRMVMSQRAVAEEVPRRDDAQVWRRFEQALEPAVARHLQQATFDTPSVKVTFPHAVKNGAWHVIQPISMDYKRPESMQQRASQWVGTAVGLQQASDLGTVFFLLGSPERHHKAYERAKALLDQAPVRHELIEEGDAERLNTRLVAILGHHEA